MQNISWSGYLDGVSNTFDTGVSDLQSQVTESLDKLSKAPQIRHCWQRIRVNFQNIIYTEMRSQIR